MRLCILAFALTTTHLAPAQTTVVAGNVRVQVLTPTLIRLEQKGPKGFEDRPTFHIVGRKGWPGSGGVIAQASGMHLIGTGQATIYLPHNAKTLTDVVIKGPNGKLLYRYDGKLLNSRWLPTPANMPKAWAIADTPRLVPSPQGLTPDGSDPTSGWDTENDAPDVYVFLPSTYQQLRKDFLKLTGPVELPPLYVLGFTDSRYYPYQQDEALARIDEYRKRKIPLDTFVVDTDWRIGGSHGYTPDPKYFPDMPGFLKAAKAKNVHIMFNDHPEPQAETALDPKELEYRFNGMGDLMRQGVDIWWYDRNWNVGLVQPAPHLRREAWGMKLYHDVAQRTRPDTRPLIMANVDGIDNGFLKRAPNIVAHRYPVQWTGDTSARWSFLRRGVENAVFEGVAGLNPWINEDLGGHMGTPSADLHIRYLQYGSVCPFMRVHCTRGETREPWAFGPDAEKIARDYINMRYRLMPLLYAAAREAYDTGEPLLRRLDLQYPRHGRAQANDQFLLGHALLVAPITGPKDPQDAPLTSYPGGIKAEYFANKDLAGQPAVTRQEKGLNLNWGAGSPDPNIPADNFSARFTGKLKVPAGKPHKFATVSDDGVRIWIDGKLVVDKWEPMDSLTNEADLVLQPGTTHDLKIEYLELGGGALIRGAWSSIDANDPKESRTIWIPPGSWTDVWSGKSYFGPKDITVKAPLGQMPMFLREGAIIPLAPEVQWTGEKDWSTLTLAIKPGNGDFDLYEDDGVSLGYTRGEFRRTKITSRLKNKGLEITIGPASEGPLTHASSSDAVPPTREWKLRIIGGGAGRVTVDGRPGFSRYIPREDRQPFQSSGGEPIGPVMEIVIPVSRVAEEHVVRIE